MSQDVGVASDEAIVSGQTTAKLHASVFSVGHHDDLIGFTLAAKHFAVADLADCQTEEILADMQESMTSFYD